MQQEKLSLKKKNESKLMLILTGVILLYSQSSYSENFSFEKFEESVFRLPAPNEPISFQLTSKELSKLLKSKIKSFKENEFKVDVLWNKNGVDLKLSPALSDELVLNIKNRVLKKLNLFYSTNFKQWKSELLKTTSENGWLILEESTTLEDHSEVRLRFENNVLTVIEKLATGKVETRYYYEKKDWSKKLVLDNVRKEIIEGNQIHRIGTKIFYKEVDELGQFIPVKLTVNTEQKLFINDKSEHFRKVIEEYNFTGFKYQ